MLCLRRESPTLFVGGSYSALRGDQNIAAFARSAEGQTLIVAAPIQVATLTRGALLAPMGSDVWRDARLPVPGEVGRQFGDVFTGRACKATEYGGRATLRVADLFADFPVAALLAE
jgi:maltooligosyltrehalose synthase